MKTIVHVNQHVIKANTKNGESNPSLTVKDYLQNRYGHEAIIRYNGIEVGRFIHSPDKPLSCGARIWFETQCTVEVVCHDGSELQNKEGFESCNREAIAVR